MSITASPCSARNFPKTCEARNVPIKFRSKRTLDEKRGLVKDITESMVKHLGCSPMGVMIQFVEYEKDQLARDGKLEIDKK